MARASVFDNQEKRAIVRRAVAGALASGVREFRYMADTHGIAAAAIDEFGEAARFAALVDALDISEPRAPVLRNRDGVPLTRPEGIREDLKGHMTGPVRWVAVMDALRAAGVRLALEAGPGAVLTRLMKRYARDLPVMSTDSPRSLARAVRAANAEPQESRR